MRQARRLRLPGCPGTSARIRQFHRSTGSSSRRRQHRARQHQTSARPQVARRYPWVHDEAQSAGSRPAPSLLLLSVRVGRDKRGFWFSRGAAPALAGRRRRAAQAGAPLLRCRTGRERGVQDVPRPPSGPFAICYHAATVPRARRGVAASHLREVFGQRLVPVGEVECEPHDAPISALIGESQPGVGCKVSRVCPWVRRHMRRLVRDAAG